MLYVIHKYCAEKERKRSLFRNLELSEIESRTLCSSSLLCSLTTRPLACPTIAANEWTTLKWGFKFYPPCSSRSLAKEVKEVFMAIKKQLNASLKFFSIPYLCWIVEEIFVLCLQASQHIADSKMRLCYLRIELNWSCSDAYIILYKLFHVMIILKTACFSLIGFLLCDMLIYFRRCFEMLQGTSSQLNKLHGSTGLLGFSKWRFNRLVVDLWHIRVDILWG